MLGIGKSEKISDEMSLFASRLILCRSKGEIARLTGEFSALVEKMIELNRANPQTLFLNRSKTIIIKIDKHELSAMDRYFRREFIKNGQCVHLTQRKFEDGTYHYEVRYRSDLYAITAESDYLAEAKEKFLEMTKTENIKRRFE